MKNFRFKYFFVLITALAFMASCEDDELITPANGDPTAKTNVNLESTVTSTATFTGEGDVVPFSVTIPQSFSSDATVAARVRLDNGSTNIGTAVVAAGSTTGSGFITVPGDDGVISGDVFGEADAATITLVGITLDEAEVGTFYTVTSNEVKLNVVDRTLGPAAGLNVLFDWENAPAVDLDMYMFSATTFEQFESAESGSRYEVDLFQNAGRADDDYFVAVGVFENGTDDVAVDIDFLFALTLPTGVVDIYTGTFVQAEDGDFYFPVVNFTKTTDVETGTVSYTTSLAN